jgi:hypothetical protein
MGLFQKAPQHRIIIASSSQDELASVAAQLKARKLKDTAVSPLQHADERWQCIVSSSAAEAVYTQAILPLLYGCDEPALFEIFIEFADDAERVKTCPQELLASFELPSGRIFGDDADNTFLQTLRHDVLQNSAIAPAAVMYYIVSGGAVTMCVPAADLDAAEELLKQAFAAHTITRFMVHVAERGQ